MNTALSDLVPDDLILITLSFVDATDLGSFQSTCSRYRNLHNVDDLWRALCKRRWKDWPLYASNERLNAEDNCERSLWRQRYRWVTEDYRRTSISLPELESLAWNFNFLPWAGGSPNGQSRAYFLHRRLYILKYLWMYPLLPYNLFAVNEAAGRGQEGDQGQEVDEGDLLGNMDFLGAMELALAGPLRAAVETAQASAARPSGTRYLKIGSFPIHYIARTADGGWLIWNQNVVFFSDGSPREVELPDQLDIHLDMFTF